MSGEPLVSVVTPVFNGGDWLQACIESVQAQTHSRHEHVILDNASTDGSAEMVAASRGLGFLIWFGKDLNNMAVVMVGMACISLTVLAIDSLFRTVEDRLLPWERHKWRNR